MRVRNLLWSLFGVVALSACSSESEVWEGGTPDVGGESRFMAVEVMNPSAAGLMGVKPRAGEQNDGGNEKGSAAENKINSLRFYFFDNAGNPVTVNGGVNHVTASSITEEGDAMDNVELKLKAVLVINTKQGDNANVNTMLAVANYENANLGAGSLSLEELQKKAEAYVASENENFLMTSSSYAGVDGPVTVATVKPENLCTSENAALDSPVKIYIERLVAKTRLSTEWIPGVEKLPVTYKDRSYEAVALKDKNDQAIMVGGKQVYAIFTGWNVTGTADKSRLLKKVNTTAAWNLGWTWNHADAFRSYWAMNPEEVNLGHVSYNQADVALGGSAYCYENAADDFTSGTKSGYEPASQISNRTQALIAAVLVTVGEDGKTALPISLAKWAGSDYTEEQVLAAMCAQVTSEIFYETTEGEPSAENPRTFASIDPSHVKLVSGQDAGMADDDSEDSKRYLSYLKLTEDAAGIQFYTAAVKSATNDAEIEKAKYADAVAVNAKLSQVPGAKVWQDGKTYYYTDLRHFLRGEDATKGLYGVVRNHIYEVKINSVKGLGTPVLNPEEAIIPQKPKDDDTFIAAQVNVLSWRVVKNDVSLEW